MLACICSYRACKFLIACARAACAVWSEISTSSPSHSRIACENDQFLEDFGELACECVRTINGDFSFPLRGHAGLGLQTRLFQGVAGHLHVAMYAERSFL
jgi:hypothetical protein